MSRTWPFYRFAERFQIAFDLRFAFDRRDKEGWNFVAENRSILVRLGNLVKLS